MRMHAGRTLWVGVLVAALAGAGCGGGEVTPIGPTTACADGEDNDGDGAIDFPDDLGCTSAADESEDSLPSPQCDDGRDNDGDGKTDFPADPGCFAPQADGEDDDCPDGPQCPQCADGIDNDESGAIDYPNDPGCTSASDDDEFLHNPVACGAGMLVMPLPTSGMAMGTLGATSTSMIISPCGGGGGAPAFAYELHLSEPRVVEVSTDDAMTTADTVIDIRSEQCSQPASHLACSDDISSSNPASKVTTSLPAGDYYIIVGGHDASATGSFALQVKTYAGEGTSCTGAADCGPGLVCRIPVGASALVCSKPQCSDGADDDGDGKTDYPLDPGCTAADDNDEADTCPAGPDCPECGDGVDNDGDGGTDYPADTTCLAAGDSSESCVTTDGVRLLTLPMTTGDTAGASNDVTPSCGTTGTHTAPDHTYRLDVPALTSLQLSLAAPSWSPTTVLLDATCGGTPLQCKSFTTPITLTNVAAGAYFYIVDGYSTGSGTYTITTTGTIANNASCESALAQSGALACGAGYACKGTVGARTCQPALCSDGVDNDMDGKIDYPFDPGCASVADDTEADPTPAPVCANGMDDDADGASDWPADYGCSAASGTTEAFCTGEVDPTSLITTSASTGSTVGAANNFASSSCQVNATGPDLAFGLSLPVPVASLVVDLSNSDFDTVVTLRDAQCGMQLGCDDDSGDPGLQSKMTVSNVLPGNYAIVVDGYGFSSGAAGTYQMTVKGTVAPQTACTSPLFSGGASAVLVCPTGTSCTAGVCQ